MGLENNNVNLKNKWIALALCVFFGMFGFHKFYEGKTKVGILYFFTFGLFGVGWFIDIFSMLTKPNPYEVTNGIFSLPKDTSAVNNGTEVFDAVKKSGTGTAFWNGSIKIIQNMLFPSETVVHALTANVATAPVMGALKVNTFTLEGKASGTVAITNQRIIFCNSILGEGTTKEMRLDKIQSIDEANTIFGFSRLRIQGLTEMFVIDGNKKMIREAKQALYTAMQNQ